MHKNILILLATAFFLLPLLMSHLPIQQANAEIAAFHSKAELERFTLLFPDTLLPNKYNELFAASGTCDKCHGYDTAMVASVDPLGQDINVVDDWRSTMMANSAIDPFWRAKVSHEVIINPQHQVDLENKCTSCHAPLGNFNAFHIGEDHYSMADLALDTMGLDGVSCLACHQQKAEGLGSGHSGNINFDTMPVAYGPFAGPLASPMALETGWLPVYGPHIQDAGVCASCHSLLTSTVDLDGNYTGNTFVEQATYHEWLNSDYNDQGITCQGCHMPQFTKAGVLLASGLETEPRSPFGLHELVGANTLMLKIIRDNAVQLGANALPEQFDETISKTLNLLQNQSLSLDFDYEMADLDSIDFFLELTNLAGHKFPSGYPARRLFIEFIVQDDMGLGDTLFASGLTDETFEVLGHDLDFEPHYNIIRAEEEVQIYELVMGDVNGDVTTVLERANQPLKDNRLVPKGFTLDDPVYDTTRLAGAVLLDQDFNFDENDMEGSGTDQVVYRVPLSIFNNDTRITAKVFYQSAPPKWMKEMFDESSAEIDAFRDMFDAADRSPVLIREAELFIPGFTGTAAIDSNAGLIQIYPNPAKAEINFEIEEDFELTLYTLDGKMLSRKRGAAGKHQWNFNLENGIYLFRCRLESGVILTNRLIIRN